MTRRPTASPVPTVAPVPEQPDGQPLRYVVQCDKAEDLIVDDEHLVLELAAGWATFKDSAGIALAIPVDRIRSIQRLDEPDPLETDEP